MRYTFALLIVCCFLFSCKQHHADISPTYYHSFPKDTLVKVMQVPMEPIQIIPQCILKSHGRVLVRTSTTDTIYAVFQYPEMKFLGYDGDRTELYVPLSQSNDDLFLIRNDSLCLYELTKENRLRQSAVFYLGNKNYKRMLGLSKLNDKMYVYGNSYAYSGLSEYFLLNIASLKVSSFGSYPEAPTRFKSISDFKSAYAHGVKTKPDGNKLVVFYHWTRRLRIYNQEGELLNDIILDYSPSQSIVHENVDSRFIHITDVYTTDNYIYILCPDQEDSNNMLSSSLLVMGWDGKPIIRYRMNYVVDFFFVDEKAKKFCGTNANDMNHFYFFDLNK